MRKGIGTALYVTPSGNSGVGAGVGVAMICKEKRNFVVFEVFDDGGEEWEHDG